MPVEPNKKKTGLCWKQRKPRSLINVDDSMMITKVNVDSALPVVLDGGRQDKDEHEVQTQNLFRRKVNKAESR